jgi:alkyldihydroxyacetonephosphate synthase
LEAVDERVLVFSHLSHVYRDGASLYVTYLFRRSSNPQETISCWKRLKTAASQVIVNHGGTISHQHGVGLDHAPYLAAEKGPVGMAILQGIFAEVDPQQIMNQGKLIS